MEKIKYLNLICWSSTSFRIKLFLLAWMGGLETWHNLGQWWGTWVFHNPVCPSARCELRYLQLLQWAWGTLWGNRDSLGEQLLSVALSSADPRDFRLEIRAMANAAWHRINSPGASSLLLQSCHGKNIWVGLRAPHGGMLQGGLGRWKRNKKGEFLKRSILQYQKVQSEGEFRFQ